jgi:flavin-dependent dehydrogenase
MDSNFDVVIVGGGPAGSTVGSMLMTYRPELKVAIFEREKFPREHVGESLLPTVGRILDEIGAWELIEAAGYPIKIGATYKWGVTDDLWDFNLLDTREVVPDAPRPGKYEGWRMRSAFQVERSSFDEILLDHAAGLGCEVFEEVSVKSVESEGDSITSIQLSTGDRVTAKHFVDASGNSAVLRKAMNVEVEEPPSLRNIAIWDYWEDAQWAVSIGIGATRVQVTSLGYGWIWVIPISATRTSIGLVCPAEYYKSTGKRPEPLYEEAVRTDPRISALIADAKPDGQVKATKDWSFLAKRMVGENWYLVGEAAGFADPILAAGITMTMMGAKECAHTILEAERGKGDLAWMKAAFQERQEKRVRQHVQFANFWYSSNAHFSDLMEYTSEIAKEAGLKLDANAAWQWLGTGGFVSLDTAGAGLAGHSLEHIKNLQRMMFQEESAWQITRFNVFELNLDGITVDRLPIYLNGEIKVGKVFRRDGKELPVSGGIRLALEALQTQTTLRGVIHHLQAVSQKLGPMIALTGIEALETMLSDGWIIGSYDKTQPLLRPQDIPRTTNVDWNRDSGDPIVRQGTPILA